MRTDYELFNQKFHDKLNKEVSALRNKHYRDRILSAYRKAQHLPNIMQIAIITEYQTLIGKSVDADFDVDLFELSFLIEPQTEEQCIAFATAYKNVMEANEAFHIARLSEDDTISDAFDALQILLKLSNN